MISLLTFPKNGALTNKQATSSAVLFWFCFISELKKELGSTLQFDM